MSASATLTNIEDACAQPAGLHFFKTWQGKYEASRRQRPVHLPAGMGKYEASRRQRPVNLPAGMGSVKTWWGCSICQQAH